MNYSYITVILLFGCSGLYTTKLGISPIYFTSLTGIGLLLIDLLKSDRNLNISDYGGMRFSLFLILFLLTSQLFSDPDYHGLINLIMAPAMFPIVVLAALKLHRYQLKKIVHIFLILNLLLMTIECAYRISHPRYDFLVEAIQDGRDVEESSMFYAYKFNSLMYIDSNFVGLQLAIIFAFLISLQNIKLPVSNIYYIWTAILTFGTLSRASIITMIFIYALSIVRHFRKLTLVLFSFALFLLSIFTLYIIMDDLSFLSKFDILIRLIDFYMSTGVINILLGVGVGRSVDFIGIGGHILPVVYSLELGLLATILIAIYWTRLIIRVPILAPILIALLINGLALTTFAIPYFYASMAIISVLYMKTNSKFK